MSPSTKSTEVLQEPRSAFCPKSGAQGGAGKDVRLSKNNVKNKAAKRLAEFLLTCFAVRSMHSLSSLLNHGLAHAKCRFAA